MNREHEILRQQLIELHRAEPFEPFRIKLLNGDGHNVGDPWTLAVQKEMIWIFSHDQHWAVFPIAGINSLESLISDFHAEALAHQSS